MQLLLVAIAGCTGIDIVSILQKKQADLMDMQVKVAGKRADDYPMIWTYIHITYLLWGNSIKAKDVEQAIELSENKYCSVGIMLGKSAKISSEYKILKPGEIFSMNETIKDFKNIIDIEYKRAWTPKSMFPRYQCKECNKRLRSLGQVKIHKCSLKYILH